MLFFFISAGLSAAVRLAGMDSLIFHSPFYITLDSSYSSCITSGGSLSDKSWELTHYNGCATQKNNKRWSSSGGLWWKKTLLRHFIYFNSSILKVKRFVTDSNTTHMITDAQLMQRTNSVLKIGLCFSLITVYAGSLAWLK